MLQNVVGYSPRRVVFELSLPRGAKFACQSGFVLPRLIIKSAVRLLRATRHGVQTAIPTTLPLVPSRRRRAALNSLQGILAPIEVTADESDVRSRASRVGYYGPGAYPA